MISINNTGMAEGLKIWGGEQSMDFVLVKRLVYIFLTYHYD